MRLEEQISDNTSIIATHCNLIFNFGKPQEIDKETVCRKGKFR